MMDRRPRFVASLGLVLAGIVLLVAPVGAAPATRIVDSGWWWKLQTGAVTQLPPPPNVEDGMLQVQGAPDGAQSIAAISAELPDGEGAPVLTLRVAEGGDQGGAAAVLLACNVTSPWTGEDGGRWDSRPQSDCTSAVNGIRSEDGASWTFALGPLQSEDELNVVLRPGTVDGAPEGANGSSFTLVFEEPTAADIATTSGTSAPPSLPPLESFTPPPSGGDSSFGGDDFSSGSFEPAPVPDSGPMPALDDPAAPVAEGEQPAAPADEAAAPRSPVPAAAAPDSRTLARVLGAVVVLLGLAGAFAATRTPALAGAAATPDAPVTGGLGRFARERTHEPNAVS